MQSKHYTDWLRRPAFHTDQPIGNLWGKKADASCCYLWMRDSAGWNNMLDDGLREDIGFSSGTQFLEGMKDAHVHSSVLSILAGLWPCRCHTVDAACRKATLRLQTGLNGPSSSWLCFMTEVNLLHTTNYSLKSWQTGPQRNCHLFVYGSDCALSPLS